jgi:predicted transposase YbfD/YdcC
LSILARAADRCGSQFDVGESSVSDDLLTALAAVPDPRRRRGVRHRLNVVLAVAVCAVLAGARSYVAIAEWAHDLPIQVRRRLGIARAAPSESAIRRMLQRIDPHQLDRAVSNWLVTSQPETGSGQWAGIAVDGKTARGARTADGRAVHLLGAMSHSTGAVLGQRVVDGKSNEIPAFAPAAGRHRHHRRDRHRRRDATQREHADYLARRGAHFIFVAKANQPKLLAQLKDLPWRDIPPADLTGCKGHGRLESRTVKTAEISTGIGFPHARTAIQITRRRKALGSATKWQTETVHAITDLAQHQIRPDQLADALRNHWHIENGLHWVRDVTFAEDHSQIRTGNGPAVMATLRNLAISIHRRHGATN